MLSKKHTICQTCTSTGLCPWISAAAPALGSALQPLVELEVTR